ncbi:MAG: M13 family metallopeptidase [Prevotella sp.]|nr:M13 family metallopeptidase [Prevotella sp.]
MRRLQLWAMNFIVLGSTGWLTSCVDNIDNPSGEVDPVTPATNPVEESVFSKLMDHTTYCGDDFYQYGVGQWIKENPVPTEDEEEVVGTNETQGTNALYALATILMLEKNPVAASLSDAYSVADFKDDSLRLMKKVEAVERVTTKDAMLQMMASLIKEGYPSPVAIEPMIVERKVYPMLSPSIEYSLEIKDMVRMGVSMAKATEIHQTAMNWKEKIEKLSSRNSRGRGYNPYANLVLVSRAGVRSAGTDFISLIANELNMDLSAYAADKDCLGLVEEIVGLDLQTLKNLASYFILNRDFKYLPLKELENDMVYAIMAARDKRSGLTTSMSHSYVDLIPKTSKEEVTAMFKEMRTVFRERINRNTWLSDATKAKAQEKLDAMEFYCGWPESFNTEWEATRPQGSTAYEKVCDLFKQYIDITRKMLGETSETAMFYANWLDAGAYTANAFYTPQNNAIILLASNLVAPIYDKEKPPFYNYAVLGASTIGHEMTHGFDTLGSDYNAQGKEENWWQAQDKEMFKQKQQAMIEHFNKLEYMPGVYCDGKKTLGENIADLGGLEMAYEAYMKTVTATGEERNHLGREFFRAFAVAWMANATAKALEIYKTDEHAWHKLRVNGNVNLTDEWYDLFNIQSGKMYLKPEQRITIW